MSVLNISPNLAVTPLTPVPVKTANYTATINQLVPVNAIAGVVTVTLPAAPVDKAHVTVKKTDTSTNAVTIATAGSDVINNIGGPTSANLTVQNQTMTLQYASGSSLWYVVSSDTPYSAITNAITTQVNAQAAITSASYVAKATAGTTSGYVPAVQSDGSIAWVAPTPGPQGTPGDVTGAYQLGTVATGTLNLSSYTNGGMFHLTLSANLTTITLPTFASSKAVTFELIITQDTTGGWTIAYPTGTKSSDSNLPTLSLTGGSIDTIALIWDGIRWKARLVERLLG